MAGVVVNQGLPFLNTSLASVTAPNRVVRPYANDVTPDVDTEYADLSWPANGNFSEQALSETPTDGGVIDDIDTLTYALHTWNAGVSPPSETIYGFAVYMIDTSTLLWAERLPAPIPITADGQSFGYQPRFSMQDRSTP